MIRYLASFYLQLHHLLWEIVKQWFPLQFLTTKIQTLQQDVCKSHEKYEKRILYFSYKYECNISNKCFKLIHTKAAVKRKNSLFFLSEWSMISKTINLHSNKLRKNIHKSKTKEITKFYNLYWESKRNKYLLGKSKRNSNCLMYEIRQNKVSKVNRLKWLSDK